MKKIISSLIRFLSKFTKDEALIETSNENSLEFLPYPPMPKRFSNLESSFITTLEKNTHLLRMAKLYVVPHTVSSFKTKLYCTEDKISEGLLYLLKGTIALGHQHKDKMSLQWRCLEKKGRLFLELNLYGIETDQKSLYQNVLLDGEGSAPAHFGRTEKILEESAPVVSLRTGHKRTTVTLSLEGATPLI